jgi:GT2 family glycosyltransferase
VAVPSYGRGQLLVQTIDALLRLEPPAAELIVVDQTPEHEPDVAQRLQEWHEQAAILWIRRSAPSIPAAMNTALRAASGDIILFLDDDIIPQTDLVAAHGQAHDSPHRLVAGRVVQPWDDPKSGDSRNIPLIDPEAWLSSVIGANFSVDRATALEIAGFDEAFVGTAYRFEADFARRFAAHGGEIRYAGLPCVRHLRAPGGTRSGVPALWRSRYRQARGEYYCLLRARWWGRLLGALVRRPLTALTLAHRQQRALDLATALPAELAALVSAVWQWLRGPRLLEPDSSAGRSQPGAAST